MKHLFLKPSFSYWLTTKGFMLLIIGCFICFSAVFSEFKIIKLLAGTISILCLIYSFYHYIKMMFYTKWIVDNEQIKIYKGIFVRTVDYIELYRIYDYQQKQSIVQSIIGNVTILIFSGDKSNPILKLYGIAKERKVIQEIRNRVEYQKKNKGVYEFTNR